MNSRHNSQHHAAGLASRGDRGLPWGPELAQSEAVATAGDVGQPAFPRKRSESKSWGECLPGRTSVTGLKPRKAPRWSLVDSDLRKEGLQSVGYHTVERVLKRSGVATGDSSS